MRDNLEKIKGSLSEMERFTRKHITETLTVVAILVGAFSAWTHFFVGGLGMSLFIAGLCAIMGIFFPSQCDRVIKKIYSWSYKERKVSEMIVGGIKIAIALFLPFIYFGFFGLLAGMSYHYYNRHAESEQSNRNNRAA